MARPQKQGLEYFSFDVSFFSDIRIRKLIKYHGIQAVPVYEILLCRIYEGGYYIAWDDDLPFIISEVSDLEEDTIMEIINYCIEVGLFNKTVFEEHKVLTSRSIQQRYVSACSLTKRKVSADMPYLLIEISNGHVNSEKTSVSSEQTLVFSEETPVNSEETLINSENSTQRKEKERKDNNSLRSSLSPTTPTPSACVREGENEGDGRAIDPDGPMKASDAVAFLRNDRDWQLQMQRKFKMESSFILRWFDSFVVDCDCRGKQEHESLSDVKQHFNDWMTKMSRSQTAKGCKGSSLPHVVSMEERWIQCRAELCKAVSADVSRQSFDVVKFMKFDTSTSELHLEVPRKETYEYMEANLVKVMTSIMPKYFGIHIQLKYHIPEQAKSPAGQTQA